jgi:hypothetical protein
MRANAASRDGRAEDVIERDGMKVRQRDSWREIGVEAQPSNTDAIGGFLAGSGAAVPRRRRENGLDVAASSDRVRQSAGGAYWWTSAALNTGTSGMLSPT